MQVVVKAKAILFEDFVQSAFAGMSKGRMTDIMHEGEGFAKVFIQPKGRGDCAGDLGDFHGMRQAAAEVVRIAVSKDLRFTRETAKGACVDDASTIALERGAVGMRVFRVGARRQ